MINPEEIEDISVFLSLSYLLEIESAERYSDLERKMRARNLTELEALFHQLSTYGEMHAQEIISYSSADVLPSLSSFDFQWEGIEGPETTHLDLISYEMTVAQVLEIALHNEIRGRDFYANLAKKSPNPKIRELAKQFTEEENEHVELLKQRIKNS